MIALLGLGPRSVDESKSATANSCVVTKPKSTTKGTQHLTSHGAFDGSAGISELELVKTFCSICILGENYEKSRFKLCRNRLWKKKFRGYSNQFRRIV
ncbi:hypothetical protein BWD12_18175 [Leptospira santarosai serovar Bananal]|nr:hypothetical protein BV917_13830 [Leptospira santarosai serovar Guaricura]OLY63935.1 hypothetical protein BWD11_11855 [Leptospira santarosai serovar Grippotyphosa]ONF76622.1 hypothetical protein BWD12_18175 [Leptospira santarosai serovar Bananal]